MAYEQGARDKRITKLKVVMAETKYAERCFDVTGIFEERDATWLSALSMSLNMEEATRVIEHFDSIRRDAKR